MFGDRLKMLRNDQAIRLKTFPRNYLLKNVHIIATRITNVSLTVKS